MLRVHFLVLLVGIIATHANVTTCLNETMPEDQNLVCSVDYGISPNTGNDLARSINTALRTLSSSGRNLFLPAGLYLVGCNIHVKSGVDIVGSLRNPTILRSDSTATSVLGDEDYKTPIDHVEIRHLFLDNVRIKFYGSTKTEITIKYNGIFNTKSNEPQISVSHRPFIIHGNVLLRGKYHAGLGISTYRNVDTTVSGNYIGDLAYKNKARNHIDTTTKNLIDSLQAADNASDISISGDQGNYISAWYATNELTDSVFTKNFINGNTLVKLYSNDNSQYDIARDHAIYIKQYNDVEVTENYFHGWPSNASGQVKFRNASHLYFVGNYLDNISFNARPYNTSEILNMDNTFIMNNFVKGGNINYWQNFTDSDTVYINASNYVVSNNLMIKSKDETKNCHVNTTKHSTHGEFLSLWNRYQDTTNASCEDFTEITTQDFRNRLPNDKRTLNDVQTLPIAWQDLGSIGGVVLSSGDTVAIQVLIYDTLAAKTEFTVDDYWYTEYRWPLKIAEGLNNLNLGHIKAGEYHAADNSFEPISSAYRNKVWIGDHIDTPNTQVVIYKRPANLAPIQSTPSAWQDIGTIGNVQLTDGDTIVAQVLLNDECLVEVESTVDGYWSMDYRWPLKIAEALNNEGYAGLKGGDSTFTPRASAHKNKVWVDDLINAADMQVVLFKK
jgi:hypothetical protein